MTKEFGGAFKSGMKKAMDVVAGKAGERFGKGKNLKRRSGRYAQSIFGDVRESPAGITGYIQTNVVYAAIHETGFDGVMNIRAHTRKTRRGLVYSVKAHIRHVKMPARPLMTPAMAENIDEVIRIVENEIAEEMET